MTGNGNIELRDGDALDILADKWRKANGGYGTNEAEISGGDVVELVGGLLKETGRALVFTPATVENMIEYYRRNPDGAKALCVSLGGPEEYSADPGDYFTQQDKGEAVKDEDHEPMILAVRAPSGLRDALNGAPIHVEHS